MATLVPSVEDNRVYEFCVLFPYPLGQKEESQALKEVEGLFTEAGGKIISTDRWGRRGLAYPIKGSAEGSYVVYYVDLDPSKLKEIDTALKINKQVLRHMAIKPPKGYQIVQYSAQYEQWLKDRESLGDQRTREREEKLRAQVAKKAQRRAKAVTEKKEAGPALSSEALTKKLDKLVSDDSLDNI